MSVPRINWDDVPLPNEVTYAEGRLTTRTYVSRSFITQFGRDAGYPSRYVHRVIDEVQSDDGAGWDWTMQVISTTPGGRKQIQLHVARESGAVRKIRIQRVPTSGDLTRLENVLELDRDQSMALLEALRAIDAIPIEGDQSVYVDDQLLRDVFSDPGAIARVYADNPDRFRSLIESDATAEDVVALQRRRAVVTQMRMWIDSPEQFDAATEDAGGPERAWQRLLEENPWVLGIGLGGQLLTSWDEGKLEQTVVGRSIKGVGKRVDALLASAGIVRSLVFAEIKHHRTALLAEEYRSGCFAPSKELAGAVVQVQQTTHLAARDLGDFLQGTSAEGELLSSGAFILRPRSFVIVGSQSELTGATGGPLPDRVRSFELFRRNLLEPEVITFDELVARAEWHLAEAEDTTGHTDASMG